MVNQRDIVNRIADKTGLYKKDIKEMLLAFKEVMVDVIEEDESMFLKEIFTLKTITKKPRKRYIAPYGKTIMEKEHKIVKILPGSRLTEIVTDSQNDTEDRIAILTEENICDLLNLYGELNIDRLSQIVNNHIRVAIDEIKEDSK